MNPNQRDGNQAVVRAFQVLEAFTDGDKELGVRELGRQVDLPKSTTQRLVNSLKAVGALEQNPDTGRYCLGFKLFELGSLVAEHRGFQQVHQHLEALVDRSGETAHLAVLDTAGYAVLVDKIASPQAVTVGGVIGTRRPVYCSAIGKALTAFLPESELAHLLAALKFEPRTPQTITSPDRFRNELAQVRQLGYAVDNEEFEKGLRCLAAPIFDARERVIAAIGISGPSQRLSTEMLPELADMVQDEAAMISQELGHSFFVINDLKPR